MSTTTARVLVDPENRPIRGHKPVRPVIEALPGIGRATVGRLMGLAWKYTDR